MRIHNVVVSALFFCLVAQAQSSAHLDNDAVTKFVKAGLSEDIIFTTITSQPGTYSLAADDIITLKSAGVTDRELAAMIMKGNGPAYSASAPGVAPQNTDLGVYFKKKSEWVDMTPDAVNWKTGGVMKSIASYGIVKGDVNGHIGGAHGKVSLAKGTEFMLNTADGVTGTDYQLVHLHEHSDSREFRTMTGGVFHASGGASRDAVGFEAKRTAHNSYSVILPSTLALGESAFLAPSLTNSSAAGSTGKAYTFQVIE